VRTIAAALTIVVVALVTLQTSVPLYPRQREAHWINVPSSLRQMNEDETELDVLGVAVTSTVWLGAFTSSQPVNRCDWWYRLEVEVRTAGDPFTFEPTHVGDWIPRSFSKQSLAYPLVNVSGLQASTAYRWIARERVQPFAEFPEQGQVIRCEPGTLRSSDWTWHHVPFDFSFRTQAFFSERRSP
jgi:hypothetical protein